MLIYARDNSPRLQYVLKFIFRDVLTLDFRVTGNDEEFRAHGGPKVNYSSLPFENAIRIPASGLLGQQGTGDVDPGLDKSGAVPVLFHRKYFRSDAQNGGPERIGEDDGTVSPDLIQKYGGDANPDRIETDALEVTEDRAGKGGRISARGLDFDLFAAVFFMISRYEEYLPFKGDRYGRFEAAGSLAGRNGFLEIPVVDIWIRDFSNELSKFFRGLKLPAPAFRFLPTCDIDLPYAYLHRGRARSLGARMRAGIQGRDDPMLRKQVLSGKAKDPFDTFADIEAIHSLHEYRPTIFFLTARYGKFDKSINPRSRAFRDLVKQTMKYADVGLHPSYRSSENPAELPREVRTLSGITGAPVTRSRQHYLKFSLPKDYRNYTAAGIREEYSMGFASAAGFRAGTSRPFLFYDLAEEKETSMRVVPFQVMDRTLKDYMQLTPRQALERIKRLAGAVRSTGGTFVSIWHNDAFSEHGEWKGWKDVYLQMIDSLAD